ncbi:MAG: methyltransferase domain-containing protein [Desulfovibrio sp.]|nr:MAG: methyltransferase domain-containing protein [Desulfovibrio sp.]
MDLAGRTWQLERAGDLAQLWDQLGEEDFGDDERIPYWTEIWPSSLGLGEWLAEQQVRIEGKLCLDLGCGLGLTALVGASLGGRVVGIDYEADALGFARINGPKNGMDGIAWLLADWREPCFRRGCAPVIWGADVMYEKRFIEPVSDFLSQVLAPGGVAWLAEPGRRLYEDFVDHVLSTGWDCRQVAARSFDPPYASKVRVPVNVWELRRKDG